MNKHILYLASGNSRRFGSNKLFHSLNGKPMYLWGLEMLREVVQKRQDCDLTVVSRYEEIRWTVEQMGFSAVDCVDSIKGISYTIRAGVYALGDVPKEDYLLFVVADQPYLTGASVEKLLEQADEGVECASLCFGEQQGNPGLFSAKLIPELLVLEGDEGGRAVLKQHDCVFVEAGSMKELEDIDTR